MWLGVGNAIDPQTGESRPQPWEYVQLRLCRDIYHCTPSELDGQDWATVEAHLQIINTEEEIRRMKQG
jgi:hypothetical protein